MNTDLNKIHKNSSWSHQFQTFLLSKGMDVECVAVKLVLFSPISTRSRMHVWVSSSFYIIASLLMDESNTICALLCDPFRFKSVLTMSVLTAMENKDIINIFLQKSRKYLENKCLTKKHKVLTKGLKYLRSVTCHLWLKMFPGEAL